MTLNDFPVAKQTSGLGIKVNSGTAFGSVKIERENEVNSGITSYNFKITSHCMINNKAVVEITFPSEVVYKGSTTDVRCEGQVTMKHNQRCDYFITSEDKEAITFVMDLDGVSSIGPGQSFGIKIYDIMNPPTMSPSESFGIMVKEGPYIN